MEKFTVFCMSPCDGDSIWSGVVEAENIDQAKNIAEKRMAEEWGCDYAYTHSVIVLSGEVKPLYICG